MSKKKDARLKEQATAAHIAKLEVPRLCVYRSPRHIYAQIISAMVTRFRRLPRLLEKELRSSATGNTDSAAKVGALIAEQQKQQVSNKSLLTDQGYKYHGRVKALADAAREGRFAVLIGRFWGRKDGV